MPQFQLQNACEGVGAACHTATGYECCAILPLEGVISDATFFIRHIVGEDGNPYAEVGLKGLEKQHASEALELISQALREHGFSYYSSLAFAPENVQAFAPQTLVDEDTVAVLLHAPQAIIVCVMEAVEHLVDARARAFICEQEHVPHVLFKSMYHTMYPEMKDGPGGGRQALRRLHYLAKALTSGTPLAQAS